VAVISTFARSTTSIEVATAVPVTAKVPEAVLEAAMRPAATVPVMAAVVEGASVLAWKIPLATPVPVTARDPDPTELWMTVGWAAVAVTANEPEAEAVIAPDAAVPSTNVDPSVPRTTPPRGAVSYPLSVPLAAVAAGRAASGPAVRGLNPSIC